MCWVSSSAEAIRWPRFLSPPPPRILSRTKKEGRRQQHQNNNHNNNILINTAKAETLEQQQQEEEPLLHVRCCLQLVPNVDDPKAICKKHIVQTCCVDTGAQRTIMTWTTAQKLGLAHLMDHRYSGGRVIGIGSSSDGSSTSNNNGHCRIVGRIPAHTVLLHFGSSSGDIAGGGSGRTTTTTTTTTTVLAPAIIVLESTNYDDEDQVELLLGLDFLRDTQAIIDFKKECLTLMRSNSSRSNNNNPLYGGKIGRRSISPTATIHHIPFVGSNKHLQVVKEEGLHEEQQQGEQSTTMTTTTTTTTTRMAAASQVAFCPSDQVMFVKEEEEDDDDDNDEDDAESEDTYSYTASDPWDKHQQVVDDTDVDQMDMSGL